MRIAKGTQIATRRSPAVLFVAALAVFAAVSLVACKGSEQAKHEKATRGASAVSSNTDRQADDEGVRQAIAGNYLAGRYAGRKRDPDAAVEYLLKALKQDADASDLLRQSFLMLVAAGRVDEAVALEFDHAESAVEKRLAQLVRAAAALKEQRYGDVHKVLAAADDEGAHKILGPLIRAWAYAGQEDMEAALAELTSEDEQARFETFFGFHRALILDRRGSADAEESYRKALALRGTVRLIQAYGDFLERAGRFSDATTLYGELPSSGVARQAQNFLIARADNAAAEHAAVSSDDGVSDETDKSGESGGFNNDRRAIISTPVEGVAEALYSVAGMMLREGAVDAGLLYLQIALYLRPDFDAGNMLLAALYESHTRLDDAISVYRRIPDDSPLKWGARLQQALDYDKRGDHELAYQRLRAMAGESREAANDQGVEVALTALADLLREAEQFDKAVKTYDEVIAHAGEPQASHWTLFYGRGISHERSDRWNLAENDFLQALELRPGEPLVLNYLGYSWVVQGQHLEKAQRMIEQAVEQRPDDGYIVDSLGWVLYQVGKFDGAVKYLERAVGLRPEDPVINDHLGDVYWQVGRRLEARFQWRRVLSLSPEAELQQEIENKLKHGINENQTAVYEELDVSALYDGRWHAGGSGPLGIARS